MMCAIVIAFTICLLLSPGASELIAVHQIRQASTSTVSSGASCTQTPIVVQNGGFESGTLSPWIQHVRPAPSGAPSTVQIVKGGYMSGHALQMSVGYSAIINQTNIPSCEATIYNVTFAYRVLEATATCVIVAKAGTSLSNLFRKVISPLQRDRWQTTSFKYHSTVVQPYSLSFELLCKYQNSSATILLDDIQVATAGSLASPGCPEPVGVLNGGFETGQFAPWVGYHEKGHFGNPPQYSIVSPGYQSQYALELVFGRSNFTTWFFQQKFQNLCDGYQYNVSFALNWLNYTGPQSNRNQGCVLTVAELGCAGGPMDGFYYPSNTSGWQQNSYICVAYLNGMGTITVQMECTYPTPIPAFALQLDNFGIELLPPPSSNSSAAPSSSLPTSSSISPSSSSSATSSSSSSISSPISSSSSSPSISSSSATGSSSTASSSASSSPSSSASSSAASTSPSASSLSSANFSSLASS